MRSVAVLALALGTSAAGCSAEPAPAETATPVQVSTGAETPGQTAAGPEPAASDTRPPCRTEAEIDPQASGDTLPPPADVAAAPPDAEVTESGLASKKLIAGCGTEHPSEFSQVTVHYSGWTTDGRMFDSSVTRGAEATFPLNRVIAGWTEGVQLMTVGEKRRFWIPEDLAYGQSPRPGAPAGMLVFDVDLIGIADAAQR